MYKSAFARPSEISIEIEDKQRVAARKKIAGKKHVFELMKPLGKAKFTTRCVHFTIGARNRSAYHALRMKRGLVSAK